MEEKKEWKCPECEHTEYEIEDDYDDDELISQDIVCDNCGYVERVY